MSEIQEILSAIGNSRQAYAPSDDTFLMVDALSKIPLGDKEILDLGTGSGTLGLLCARRGAHATVADIDDSILRDVTRASRRLNLTIDSIRSDVFSHIRKRFDVILFNPPYLPSKQINDPAVDGGKRGRGFIDRFLGDLQLHLKYDGCALLLVSSLNDPSALVDRYHELSFSAVASRRLFFEELQVLLCKVRNLSA